MSDPTRLPPHSGPPPALTMRVPWWKRRWRRLPFWVWAGLVVTCVGVVGALADGEGSGSGGLAVAELDQPAPSATVAGSTAPDADPSSTTADTVTIPTATIPTVTIPAGPAGALTVRLIGINTPEYDECWATRRPLRCRRSSPASR